jgi:Flp pilus assembly protein TadG
MAPNQTRRITGTGEKGSELVELAIVMPIFLLIIFAIVDFGFLFQRYEVVTNAAREGARLATAATGAASFSAGNIQTRVQNYLTDNGLTGAVTISVGTTSQTVGATVVPTKTVTVLYPSTMIFLPITVNLQSVSEMRVEGAGS